MFFVLVAMPLAAACISGSVKTVKQWRSGARMKGKETVILHPRMVTDSERKELEETKDPERIRFINEEAELRVKMICQLVPNAGEQWRNLNKAIDGVVEKA